MITYKAYGITIEPENLDCMDSDALETVEGELAKLKEQLHNVSLYIAQKKCAEELRKLGLTSQALQWEFKSNAMYSKLPESLKW